MTFTDHEKLMVRLEGLNIEDFFKDWRINIHHMIVISVCGKEILHRLFLIHFLAELFRVKVFTSQI